MTATQLPLFEPASSWSIPETLPDFSGSRYIGFDTETRDEKLKKQGPGFIRGDAYVVGISLADERGQKVYLPIRHQNGKNMPLNLVQRYVKEQLSRPEQIKVGANVLYDQEALKVNLGIDVVGTIHDILVAEPLLDENQRQYNLDRLSGKYLGLGKEYDELKEAVYAYCGKKGDPRSDLWRVPPKHVGRYAEADAVLPVQIIQKQLQQLEEESLMGIFEMETIVTQLLLDMRLIGVPVNIAKAELLLKDLQRREKEWQAELDRIAGVHGINVWSGEHLAKAFTKAGEFFPRTEAGNPSFEKAWLESNPSKLAQAVVQVRKLNRLGSVFVRGTVIEHSVNGRVHCQFHQLKSDDGGTITGRFSSSNPNLQQVPARDEELAPLVRGLFIPEEDCDWHCDDYSQIEPRLQVHYAALRNKPGARDAAKRYREDPNMDFHNMTAALTGLDRRPAKTIHLGLSYGMGFDSLAENLGVSIDEAKELKAQYNQYMPFLQGISNDVNNRAADVGFIRTILGRRGRFPLWEPGGKDENGRRRRGRSYPTREEALEAYGPPVQRADTRKAFNKLIQGSAADVIKEAMRRLKQSGVLEYVRLHLQVHDELDLSIPKSMPEVGKEVVHIMETSVECLVPLKVDCEIGPSWGEVKK